ncbi:S8 family peptidase [Leptothermofonsia sp. ETS-13]|uniref:S8 family peptidase n=1 Tax=Leptothermofonsia sp. ETS-13 TaxID=3035696 RepID=UPI003BA14433
MNIFKPESEGYCPRVVVKFQDDLELPYEDGVEVVIQNRQLGPWEQLAREYPGITLKRLYTSVDSRKIQELVNQARQLDPGYRPSRLANYFVINCPPGVEPESLVKILSSWQAVQTVYFDPPGDEPFVNPADDPRSGDQGYLNSAPQGIDARYAWQFAGGNGAGLRVIDLERGWTLNHEDLAAQGATLLHGSIRDGSRAHGTAVLGELAAVDNTLGCIGITPNVASVDVVSYWGSTRPDAIMAAIANLSAGDVLLLEAQLSIPDWPNMPIEVLDAEFDAIRLATALGILVVEAAGNGSNDLDTYTDGAGNAIFNRTAPGFRDSGAIMVGAASSTIPHTRLGFSNFGSRIDCYAWGENVNTCSSNDAGAIDQYTEFFNGTSSASPIITGAALAVQGLAEANLGARFTPQQLRAILSDPALGTASNDPASDRIGVMPNLKAIIHKLEIHKRPCEICIPIKLKVPIYVSPIVIEKEAKCFNPSHTG